MIAALGVLAASCTEVKEPDPDKAGYQYFPLEAGTYRLYQVEGIRYNAFRDSTIFSYKLREVVADTFRNLESGISYILQRQTLNDNNEWQTDSVWTARKDEYTAVVVEHNVPIIRFTFPPEDGKTWDGNSLNGFPADEFEMTGVGAPWSDEYGSYDKSVMVVEEDLPDTFVKFISKKEVYAQDKGLVYKEIVYLKYMQGEYYGKEIVENGIKYHQYLIEYGKE